ncbi:hypothetical protein GGI43DRAFT_412984 [Trichoderma evansii]
MFLFSLCSLHFSFLSLSFFTSHSLFLFLNCGSIVASCMHVLWQRHVRLLDWLPLAETRHQKHKSHHNAAKRSARRVYTEYVITFNSIIVTGEKDPCVQ